ncbi:MAG: hypothetical protein WD939_06720, partial [Dehalococcoidia bacterium]
LVVEEAVESQEEDQMTTIERINELTEERARLYRAATNGRRGDADVLQRIHEISQALDELWEQRRRERVGRLEGIDLLVEKAYERAYGPRYEESVRPSPVAEPEVERMLAAA